MRMQSVVTIVVFPHPSWGVTTRLSQLTSTNLEDVNEAQYASFRHENCREVHTPPFRLYLDGEGSVSGLQQNA